MFTYESNIPDLVSTIKQYAQAASKPPTEVLLDQASKLACSDFGGNNKGLFQYAAETAPSKEKLQNLPQALGYRIKRTGRPIFTEQVFKMRKRGKHAGTAAWRQVGKKGEINMRSAHRLYQAAGWLSIYLAKYARGKLGSGNRASVEIQVKGEIAYVILRNESTNAKEVSQSHGNYIERALTARRDDMLVYVNSHSDNLLKKFLSRKSKKPK